MPKRTPTTFSLYLAREAGTVVAETYGRLFRAKITDLLHWPESGAPRPNLGEAVRVAVVSPYLIIYQHDGRDDTLILLRILHGRRNVTDRLLRR
jgi:toxin ParE1/3/4